MFFHFLSIERIRFICHKELNTFFFILILKVVCCNNLNRTPSFSEDIIGGVEAGVGNEEGVKPLEERSFWAKYVRTLFLYLLLFF